MEGFTFEGYTSVKLHGRHWTAARPSSALLIIHGIGEHSGRYSDMAGYMREHGISVMAFDLRGHGLSEGKRGVVLNWKEYREDVRAAAAEMSRRNPTLPLFILGHSLGGAIALDYIQDSEIKPRGALISAPALGTPGISPILLAVAGLLSTLAPGLVFSTGLDSNAVSSIPEECQKYRDDPLVHDKACVRLSTELKAAQKRIFERAASMTTPLLLTHGAADRIAPLGPVEEFFSAAGSGDKTLKVFENAFHEIHNDIVREDVHRLYSGWIGERT